MRYPPPGARVAVGMSGGVDSAVAAVLLTEAGYDCIGVTLRLVPEPEGKSVFEPCCSLEAAEDARHACEKLGIPHRTVHAVERFDQEIIEDFLAEYRQARTPNPCVLCNRRIKFAVMAETLDALGGGWLATGHFARVEALGDRLAVRRGAHRAKDQSYMLAALTQAQLARCCFPLGEMDKAAVREKAHRIGLSVAAKPESQEICFVPDRDYARYIEARTGPSAPGPILNTRGQVLGRHRGLIHYTVGQRRGMGVAAERPLYVLRLDPARNAVIVGFAEENRCATFTTGPLHWSGRAESLEPFACLVQLRARHTPVPGLVAANASGATVALDSPQASVTPGQWAVFYEGAYVLAAGIVRDFSPAA